MDFEDFADEWIAAWNSHDLEAILAHYHPDVVFNSPVAAKAVPDSGGKIRGLAGLRAYWGAGLPHSPNLHFELREVLLSAGGGTVLYENDRGQLVAETMLIDPDGKVLHGIASYGRRKRT